MTSEKTVTAAVTNETVDVPVKGTGKGAATMNLFAFLPDQSQKRLVVETFDAPPGFNNPDGTPAKIQMRKLTVDEVDAITRKHRQRNLVQDNKGRPMVTNGRALVDEETDNAAMISEMIVESLEFPNLKSQELQDAYNCRYPLEMVTKIFNTQESFRYIIELFNDFQFGSGAGEGNSFQEVVTQAKN